MVGWAGIAVNSDVPVVRATRTRPAGGLREGRNQLDGGLQTGCRWHGTGGNAECPVLPKDVMVQRWIRELCAIRMTGAAVDGRNRERGQQVGVVRFGFQARGQEIRLRDDGV